MNSYTRYYKKIIPRDRWAALRNEMCQKNYNKLTKRGGQSCSTTVVGTLHIVVIFV